MGLFYKKFLVEFSNKTDDSSRLAIRLKKELKNKKFLF